MSQDRVTRMLKSIATMEPEFVEWLRDQAKAGAMDSRMTDGPQMYRQQGGSLRLEMLADEIERARAAR